MEEREATPSVTTPLNQQEPNDDVFDKYYPPGYRFDPYDEEVILNYLKPKIDATELPLNLMHDVNIYKHNPDDLILDKKHKPQGKNTWYFFTSRDKKYKNGTRPSRSAGSGYWKATGADKTIKDVNGDIIGYRKALVFYLGRPPKGDKTHWIMHEFRVEGPSKRKKIDPTTSTEDTSMRLDDYVLCRINKKEERGGKDKSSSKIVASKGGAKKRSRPDPTLIKEEENLPLVDESQPPINNVVQGNGYHPPKTNNGVQGNGYPPPKTNNGVQENGYPPPKTNNGVQEYGYPPSKTNNGVQQYGYPPPKTNNGVQEYGYPPPTTNNGVQQYGYPPPKTKARVLPPLDVKNSFRGHINIGVDNNWGTAEIDAFANNSINWKNQDPEICYDDIFEEQPQHLGFMSSSRLSLPPLPSLSYYTGFDGTSSTASMMDYNDESMCSSDSNNFLTPPFPPTQDRFMFTPSTLSSTTVGPSTSSPSTLGDTDVNNSDLYAMIPSLRQ